MAKILIIEDTFDVAEIIGHNLVLNFHEVEVAHTFQSAFKKFIAFAPDLVIIDICLELDNTDGRELCKEIRSFNKGVPVILMSGYDDLLKDCELYGANDTIKKPFDIKDLLIKIDRLVK